MSDSKVPPKSIRSRQCIFVLYPESQQAQIDYCKENLPCAWALHDKDVYEKDSDTHKTGDLKKPHVHFVCKFSNARHFTGIAKDIGVPVNVICKCNNLYKAYQYLWHANNPEKYQYDPSIVGTHDFEVPSETYGLSADEDEQVKIMLEMPVFKDIEDLTRWAYENGCWATYRKNYHMWRDFAKDKAVKQHAKDVAYRFPDDTLEPGWHYRSNPDKDPFK